MRRPIGALLGLACLAATTAGAAEVAATVASTLPTDADQVRQLALDGDPKTYFVSRGTPGPDDSFTVSLDEPVAVKSVSILSGRPDGSDALDSGRLEGSEDGKAFAEWGKLGGPSAKVDVGGKRVRAIRVRPGAGSRHPLVIREVSIDSDPKVATFAYPVEFVVDTSEAPDMKAWAEGAARTCERWYGRINEALKSNGYRPIRVVRITLKNDFNVPAAAGGGRITGSVKWFKAHPDDVGAMIHETTHIVQNYRSRRNPGWLVEGVADYVRFYLYEPGKIGPIDARRAHFDGNYRVTARFLDYVSRKYDKDLVLKLNRAMREGSYKEGLFKEYTGKTVQQLDEEWRATLPKRDGRG